MGKRLLKWVPLLLAVMLLLAVGAVADEGEEEYHLCQVTLEGGTVPEAERYYDSLQDAVDYVVGKGSGGYTISATHEPDLTETLKIENNSSSFTIILNGFDITLKNDGPVIYIADSSTGNVIIKSGGITHSGDYKGSGIVNYGKLELSKGLEISGNDAGNSDGGGICNYGNVTINGATISGNTAGNGGGIYNAGTLTIESGTTISKNEATKAGGGIYSDENANLTIGGGVTIGGETILDKNKARSNGGGMCIKSKTKITIGDGKTPTYIKNNEAGGNGGGISFNKTGSVNIYGCVEITDNAAGGNGGGVFTTTESAPVNIGGDTGTVTIKDNTCVKFGGGINAQAGTLILKNVTITGNSCTNTELVDLHCGGVHLYGETLKISGVVKIYGNTCYGGVAGNLNVFWYLNSKQSFVELADEGALKEGSEIHVSRTNQADKLYYLEFGQISKDTDWTNYIGYFKSDNESQVLVIPESGKGLWVAKGDISKATINGINDTDYTGSAVTQNIEVIIDKTPLTKDADYTVEYSSDDLTNAGEVTVKITGAGDYAGGSQKKTFKIIRDLSKDPKATVDEIAEQYYSGMDVKPEVTVKITLADGTEKTLVKGTDYTVEYPTDAKSVGDGKVITINGAGCYKGSVTATYNVKGRAIDDETVKLEDIPVQYYTGSEIKPEVKLTCEGRRLVLGTDYEVAYSDNTAVGTATVTITGKGGFTDSRTATFEIKQRSLEDSVVTVSPIFNQVYNGSKVEPFINIYWDTTFLVKDTDYTVEFVDNDKIGTATATLKGIGAFKGTKVITFNIVKKSVENAVIEDIPDQSYVEGYVYRPEPTVVVNGITLKKDTDYQLSFENNDKEGTAAVIITGIGNYGGQTRKSFNIVKDATISSIEIEVPDGQKTVYLKAKGKTKLKLGAKLVSEKYSKKDLVWKSSNKKIATVNKNGLVTFKKAGTVKISCYVKKDPGVKCTVRFKVKEK